MLYPQQSSSTNNSPNDYLSPVKWRNIGPFRGGRSVGSSGVVGDPLTYYMGTTGGGLWKTEDAGQHWSNVSDGYFKTGSVGAVAVSESDPNVVYVGMGEHAPRAVMTSYGDGVYKSTDGGKTWNHLGLEKTQFISRIVIHPKNPDIVYVAAQGALHGNSKERGIYKSTNGGKSWSNLLFVNEMTGCSELSMDMSNPEVLYAAMWEHQRKPWTIISGGPGSGLYKSSDAGKTWKKIHEGLPEEKGKMAIAVCRSNSDRVYALIESDSNADKGGLFVSSNAGKSWKRVSDDNRLTQRAWYYTEVFPDPVDEHTVYVLSAPALRSIDGGKTWERLTGTHGDYHDLWINPHNPKNLCISNDGGAAISFNRGATWSTQSNMPTAQFYRIDLDNMEPYNIYAGQQDNSSVKIASRSDGGYAITERDWTASAGGESAFLAFDPDNPIMVLGGSYLGTIEVLNTDAHASTNVMAAPIQYLGRAARDMKYRFNWNAPIIWSQHEPNTYYHGAQLLLKTQDLGQTWKEVSPDLSGAPDSRLGNGGGPYTNEAVGAENYGTLSYIKESQHEAGVIWMAYDSGKLQLTKDGCTTWTDVTPKGLKDCLINAIDISPHDPATAYIATTRYRYNDHTPGLYKTTDYGETWTNISSGIPYGAYTRVVREDDVRKDLLFAGTELGVYVSYNGGSQWTPLQLNLPVTPINDLKVHRDNIIVATSGRSFWILDDLEVIRQYSPSISELKLFTPKKVMLTSGGSEMNSNSGDGKNKLSGVTAATGAVLYYNLDKVDQKTDLTLTITDTNNKVIHEYSSIPSSQATWAGGPSNDPTLSKKEGLNRFVWNLRHNSMPGVNNTYIEASFRGHKVIPGKYTATLKYGDVSATEIITIIPNPKYPTTPQEYKAYDVFMNEVEANLTEMHELVERLDDIQKVIKGLIEDLENKEKYSSIKAEGETILSNLKAWDEDMVQRKSKAYDDVENFPNKFTANYLFMVNHTESDIPRVTQPSIDRRATLDAQWEKLKMRANQMIDKEIPAFNQKLWDAGIGAVSATVGEE